MVTEKPETADVDLLRRRLARERRARLTAEQVGERATATLYETIQQLQEAHGELEDQADQQRLLHQISRELRSDLDGEAVLHRAVVSVGGATDAERCLIRLVDEEGIGPILEQWARPGIARLDDATPLPAPLQRLSLTEARRSEALCVHDIRKDRRLSAEEADEIAATLGVHSYLGAPMWVGDRLVGWLVLHSVSAPTTWTARQRNLASILARDLGAALLQAQAFRQQAEAVQRLREANRVKSDLISTVSHELRTPLSSITGYLELLQDGALGELTERQLEVLGVVDRSAGRLQHLVENLLSLSRSNAVGAPTPVARVDVHGLLSDVYRVVLPLAAERSLELELGASDPLPTVPGDARMLERVLINLVSNAIKFTPPGGRVTLDAVRGPHHVVITVADTGLGIATAELPRVFDRFYRAPEAVQREIQGTGLGLAVARSIVEEHGGSIELASALGEGTRATVTLPHHGEVPDPRSGELASATALPRARRGA